MPVGGGPVDCSDTQDNDQENDCEFYTYLGEAFVSQDGAKTEYSFQIQFLSVSKTLLGECLNNKTKQIHLWTGKWKKDGQVQLIFDDLTYIGKLTCDPTKEELWELKAVQKQCSKTELVGSAKMYDSFSDEFKESDIKKRIEQSQIKLVPQQNTSNSSSPYFLLKVTNLGGYSKFTNGEYFEFDPNAITRQIKKGKDEGTQFYGMNSRTKRTHSMSLWFNHKDFNGRPTGRWDPYKGIQPGDWAVGDEFHLVYDSNYVFKVTKQGSHSKFTNGEYFEFDPNEIQKEYKHGKDEGTQFYGMNSRTKKTHSITLWYSHKDFNGRPTGRWDPYKDIQPNDWVAGDEFHLVTKSEIKQQAIFTKDQTNLLKVTKVGFWSSKTNGQYFEFDPNAIKKFISKETDRGTTFYGSNSRTKKTHSMTLWFNHKDFSGRPTGRWDPFKDMQPNDWAAGDEFLLQVQKLPIDGSLGQQSKRALQQYLMIKGYFNDKLDGNFGQISSTSLQNFLNDNGAKLTVDGKWGQGTSKAFQTYLNSQGAKLGVDGSFGKQSTLALQNWLNSTC